MCRFFDTTERRCTVYKARPAVCRQYPNGARCGYFDFLQFERKHQDDPDFIPSA
jgi:Fe-S-cluster containining protein